MILDPIDQRIRDQGFNFVPFNRFLASPFQAPTGEEAEGNVAPGIPAIYQARSSGVGSGGAYTGGIDDLIRNYELDTRNQYFGSQPTPLVDDLRQSKLDKTFMGFPSYREIDPIGPFTPYNQPMDMSDPGASIENIIASQNVPLELTTAGKIQSGLGNIKDTASGIMSNIRGFGPISAILGSMDKFNTLPAMDQEFIKRNMGYRGPTVFGDNASGLNKDPFGINTRSAFGNYAEFVGKEAEKLGDTLSATGKVGSKFAGATFNPATGQFEIDEDSNVNLTPAQLAAINKRTNMLRQRFNFYTQKQKERLDMIEQNEKNQIAEAKAIQDANRRTAGTSEATGGYQAGYDSDFMEGPGDGRPGGGSYGGGADLSSTMGSFMDGGIVDLVDIYD